MAKNHRQTLTRFATLVVTLAAGVLTACAPDKSTESPLIPGASGPAAQFRPLAFTADINTRTGTVKIAAPTAGTANAPTLSLGGQEGPVLSLLGGEAVRLVPSSYSASAVGAFEPNRIRVTFDIQIENKLPGIRFITPTWPVAPAAGVILFPLDYTVTTTPGGVSGGNDNIIEVTQPEYGTINPSIDWNGTQAAGSGEPFSFFNDAPCAGASTNDCFRWEAFDLQINPTPAISITRRVGFDIDASVGQFRTRMIVAADLEAAGVIVPSNLTGTVTSAVRGNLAGVTVNVSGFGSATTDASGNYSITGIGSGTRTISVVQASLPSGCTAPAGVSQGFAAGIDYDVDFSVTCTGLPGNINGTLRRSNDNSPLANVTVSAGGVTAVTSATGTYSLAGVPAGTGTISVSGAAIPIACATPYATLAYSLASGATVNSADLTLTCAADAQPGYTFLTQWSDIGGGQIQLDIRVDMRTFDDAAITNQGTGTNSTDPLSAAQFSFTYPAAQLSYAVGLEDAAPAPNLGAAAVGSTGNTISVAVATASVRTGNVGVVRLVFNRVAGAPAGTVSIVPTFTAFASIQGATNPNITARVNNGATSFAVAANP